MKSLHLLQLAQSQTDRDGEFRTGFAQNFFQKSRHDDFGERISGDDFVLKTFFSHIFQTEESAAATDQKNLADVFVVFDWYVRPLLIQLLVHFALDVPSSRILKTSIRFLLQHLPEP